MRPHPTFAKALLPLAGALAALALAGTQVSAARADSSSAPTVPVYGEVGQPVGGFDSAATYSLATSDTASTQATTTGLADGKFVYPVGMSTYTDPTSDVSDIYVLDDLTPQEDDAVYGGATSPTDDTSSTVAFTYRIQEFQTGSDGAINPSPVASTTFTLASNPTYEGRQATAIAVDQADDRVYVLIADDTPDSTLSQPIWAAERLDAWTTDLASPPTSGTGALATDASIIDSSGGPGELLGPDVATQLLQPSPDNDIAPSNVVVLGTGADADVAIGGVTVDSNAFTTSPVVEKFTSAGAADGTWTDYAGIDNPAAPAGCYASNDGRTLNEFSANPDGMMFAALSGGDPYGEVQCGNADVLGTVSENLATTTPIFPLASTPASRGNFDTTPTSALTVSNVIYGTEVGATTEDGMLPDGATRGAGALGPSVIPLSGNGTSFPSGLFAGVVAQTDPSAEKIEDPSGNGSAWQLATPIQSTGGNLDTSASLGIRVFDSNGDSLSMIGNASAGETCNLQGGGEVSGSSEAYPSFIALSPGTNGTIFALVQPDLTSGGSDTNTSQAYPVDPANPQGRLASETGAEGDYLVEFAPKNADASYASDWTTCPQPSGSFSVSTVDPSGDTTAVTPASDGSISVPAGSKLQFDGSADGGIDLQGAAPWDYNWDLSGGDSAGPFNNTFGTSSLGGGFAWPTATVEQTYSTAGDYTATLNLTDDFGTQQFQRAIHVLPAGTITPAFTITPAAPTAGESVTFDASSSSLPTDDQVTNYEWDFDDGTGAGNHDVVDTASATYPHSFASAGTYTVKLTLTPAVGQPATISETVTVAAANNQNPPGGGNTNTNTGTGTTPTPPPTPVPPAPKVSPHPAAGSNLVTLSLSLPSSQTTTHGKVKLQATTTTGHGKKAKKKTVTVGSSSFTLSPGGKKKLTIHLTAAGKKLLAKQKSLKVKVTVTATNTAGKTTTTTQTVTLHAPKAKKAKKH